jgi:glycosyltransferase involved in cell wall biosynthesis
MSARSILIVAHFYPPAREVAANRPAALARYLRRLGHRVTILTSAAYGALEDDAEAGVVRTYDLQLLAARLRGEQAAVGTFGSSTFQPKAHLVSRIAVPDAHLVAWTPFALARARRLARQLRFDCAITTSPPESAHLIGSSLRRRGLPWIADLRDGWVFESMKDRIWPLRAQHRLSAWMERRMLRRADLVTTVTDPIADDLRERLGIEARVIANGFDPEDPASDSDPGGEGAQRLDPGRVSIAFTGQLGGARRDPTPLIAALAELAREEPEVAGRIELAFAGSFDERERRLFETDVSPARITAIGAVPHLAALALQRAADIALVITGPRRQEASAKLLEYFGARKPVLALSPPDTAATRIVAETGAGAAVDPRDRERIKAALRAAVAGELPVIADEARAAYGWPVLAEKMADAVEAAISAAAARRPR